MTQGLFGEIQVPGRHTSPYESGTPENHYDDLNRLGVSLREWEESLRSCDLAERVKLGRIRSSSENIRYRNLWGYQM